MGNGLKLLLMIFLGFLLIEVGLTGALGSMIGALIVPDYMGPYSNTPINLTATHGAANTQLLPRLAASVAAGTITQAQMNAVLAKIAQSTPATPNLNQAIAQALADSIVSGNVSSADANAIINAQG